MESIVSDFMTKTCRENPQPNINKFQALYYVIRGTISPVKDGDYNRIVTSSGSASEFYIEPLLTCIDDIDVMDHRNDMLAIHEGHPLPRCLPAEFHREVTVHQLVETAYPCYVLVRRFCELNKCANCDKYIRVDTELKAYAATSGESQDMHGPATLWEAVLPAFRCFNASESELLVRSVDIVPCIRCLVWSPQAAEWTTRRREYNWPDTATINCVVDNGCDVVQVAHPWCREDEVTNRRQWRLSFSRAETIILNTWFPKQQLVFHMLRVFVSTIQSHHGVSVIRRYHIKTLMMWACEGEIHPQLWNTCCVVNVCTQLLHVLAKWLTSAQFPMYFVKHFNLFDIVHRENEEELDDFVHKISSFSDRALSCWFVDNYILRYACRYSKVASSFDVIGNSLTDLQRVLTAINNERNIAVLKEFHFSDLENVHFGLQQLLWDTSLNDQSIRVILQELPLCDSRFIDFCCASCLLRCVSMLMRGHTNNAVAEIIFSTLASSRLRTCDHSFLAELEQLTQFDTNTLSRLLIHLSVEYLTSFRRVMSRDYSSVCDIVTRDYEAMYAYKCGLYEKCFRLIVENVDFVLNAEGNRIVSVSRFSESDSLLLMDNDGLSLITLARLCGVFDYDPVMSETLSQLTLLTYLLVQCKLRLRHSVTSVIDMLRVIQRVHDTHGEREIIKPCYDGVHLPQNRSSFEISSTQLV